MGRIGPTLEDVSALIAAYVKKYQSMGIVLDEEDNDKLRFLNETYSGLKRSSKGTHFMDPIL